MKEINTKYFFIYLVIIFPMMVSASKIYPLENETITVTPPAIIAIAYNPKTNTQSDVFNAVFDDFSFYLSFAMRKLKPLGVNFYIIEKQKVCFKVLNKTDSVNLAKEDALVGYVFVSSAGEVLKRYHVMTDAEITELAEKHFNLKVPR